LKEEKLNSLHHVETSFLTFKIPQISTVQLVSVKSLFENVVDFYFKSKKTRTFTTLKIKALFFSCRSYWQLCKNYFPAILYNVTLLSQEWLTGGLFEIFSLQVQK
jgi:hypothetical protein